MYCLNKETLILEIKKRPILWQTVGKDYKNKEITEKLWSEVAIKCETSVAEAKSKWKNLKDTFRRELKKCSQTASDGSSIVAPKWQFFSLMSFLENHITPIHVRGRIEEDNSTSQENQLTDPLVNTKPFLISKFEGISKAQAHLGSSSDLESIASKRSRTTSDSNTNRLQFNHEKNYFFEEKADMICYDNESPNLHFFKSLVPVMDGLTTLEQMELRSKIQLIVLEKLKEKK